MKSFIKTVDDLPLLIKLLLCIPAISVFWGIYRLCRSIVKGDTLHIVLGVVFIFVSGIIFWIIDIICILMNNKVWWID